VTNSPQGEGATRSVDDVRSHLPSRHWILQGREVSDYRSAHTSLLEEVLQPALARARRRYEDLMPQAADSPGATLGQRRYAHAGART
jgi:hypothetical protein